MLTSRVILAAARTSCLFSGYSSFPSSCDCSCFASLDDSWSGSNARRSSRLGQTSSGIMLLVCIKIEQQVTRKQENGAALAVSGEKGWRGAQIQQDAFLDQQCGTDFRRQPPPSHFDEIGILFDSLGKLLSERGPDLFIRVTVAWIGVWMSLDQRSLG